MILPIGDVQKPEKTPIVNYAIIGINVFVFLFLQPNLLGSENRVEIFYRKYAFIPAEFSFLTILFSMFLHADLLHLGGNMLFLWIAGNNVEDRIGKLGYAAFYLACGCAATLAHFALDISSDIPTIGASGAIAGVMGAYFLLCPRNQVKVFYWLWFYIGIFYISARLAVGLWFLEQLVFWALGYFETGSTGVAFDAHLGGIIFGFLVTLALIQLHRISPHIATERYTATFRRASPFGQSSGGAYSNPYQQYSNERGIFTDRPQQADWLPNTYSAPAFTPQWQQAAQAANLFTVVALRPIGKKVDEIAPLAAHMLRIAPEDAAAYLRQNHGVIAKDVSWETAHSFEAHLAQLGVAAIPLRNDNIIDLPPVQELQSITPGGVNFTLYLERFSLTKRYDEVFLIVAGAIAGVPAVDIYTYQPWSRFRMAEGSAVFQRSALSSIRGIVARMLTVHNIQVNRGVKILVDGGDWNEAAFSSREDFDRYCYWLIQVMNAKNRGLV